MPDLDLERGFDEHGFARDGSGWRALRYKPFPGTFWPTNGSTDDVFVRLPAGVPQRPARHADSRRSIAPTLRSSKRRSSPIRWPSAKPSSEKSSRSTNAQVASISTATAGSESATVVRGLPAHYVGAANAITVTAAVYPRGTEFLHSVRYVDPDVRSGLSRRMKELRYSRKVKELDRWGIVRAYEREHNEKDEGNLPAYPGSPEVGYQNAFGWQLQGFIEDERGRLRAQTEEEHRYCMGCHSTIGVTIDQTFAFARKVPGRDGWRHQTLAGMADVPQLGHADPETLVYLRRVGGGDEFRAEQRDARSAFSPTARSTKRKCVARRPGGDRDLAHLLMPSQKRALLLAKAYRALVARQTFIARSRQPDRTCTQRPRADRQRIYRARQSGTRLHRRPTPAGLAENRAARGSSEPFAQVKLPSRVHA